MHTHQNSEAICVTQSTLILSKLNHAFTPPDLARLNQQLSLLLVSADRSENTQDLHDQCTHVSTKQNDNLLPSNLEIEKIIDQRAIMVESLLNNLDEQQKRCFAAYEVKVNDFILQEMTRQRTSAKEELAKISKASKGIKKYQQV